MAWDDLSDYELRNLPAHLAAAGRTAELRDTLLDTGYLRIALSRLGLPALAEVLGEAADPVAERLLAVVTRQAAFLGAAQYRRYDGPFANHLATAAQRQGDHDLAAALWHDPAEIAQLGWLDLGLRGGRTGLPPMTRFGVPGNRESHGWDIYDAGPSGVTVSYAVDLRRGRLLTESVDGYYSQFGAEPRHYYWRIWDLRSGGLLFEHSTPARNPGDRSADWSGGHRPAAFAADGLTRVVGRERAAKRVPAAVTQRFEHSPSVLHCANGPERVYAGTTHDGGERLVVWHKRIVADLPTPEWLNPAVVVRLGERLVGFARDSDEHIWAVELANTEQPERTPGMSLPEDCLKHAREVEYADKYRETSPRVFFDGQLTPVTPERPENSGYGGGNDNSRQGFYRGRYLFEKRQRQIGVWSLDGTMVAALAGANSWYGGGGRLTGFAVSPDGERVVSTYHGHHVVVWDLDAVVSRPRQQLLGQHLPDWQLGEIAVADPITHVTFLWGGWLLAVATEGHELLVLRFWAASAVLARIGLDEPLDDLRGEPYGDSVFAVGKSGAISRYRFRYLARPGVTTLDHERLTVRFWREHAQTVEVAGSFSDWRPLPLRRERAGDWSSGPLVLPPGEHEYKLLIDGREWTLDPHMPFRDENNYFKVSRRERPALPSATSATRA